MFTLVTAALLTGCSAQSGGGSPSGSPGGTTSESVESTCPSGLGDALEAYLATLPWDGTLPAEVEVIEDSTDYVFSSDLIASMSDCSIATVVTSPSGDRMAQIYGITSLTEAEVVAQLEAAGWEAQEFADGPPYAWQGPTPEESAGLFVGGVSPQPALNFPAWADYLQPDEVLIGSGLAT